MPSVRSWIARASDGAGGSPSACASSAAVSVEVERAQRELVEPARAAQLVAQPPHAVVARQPVGAVGGDHEHRQLAERLGERGQQLERRLVGPLQVVEHDERVPLGGDVGERAADRLEQRRAVGGRRRARRARAAAARGAARSGPQPSSASRVRAQVARSAATTGPYGAVPPWVGGAAQHERVRGRRRARRPAGVLPTPASPLSSTIEPSPAPRPLERAVEPLALGLADRRGRCGPAWPESKYGIRARESTAIPPMSAPRRRT